MGDGWTGINISDVQKQLDAFKDAMKQIKSKYVQGAIKFTSNLSLVWASEKAVDFNQQIVSLEGFEEELNNCHNNILMSAAKAASFMAKYNGAEFEYDYTLWHGHYFFDKLQSEKDGLKGMNVALVKVALNDFHDKMKAVEADLDGVPMNFSMFDPAGDLQAEYKKMIDKSIIYIRNELSTIETVLNKAIEEETNNIMLGKQQAENVMAA